MAPSFYLYTSLNFIVYRVTFNIEFLFVTVVSTDQNTYILVEVCTDKAAHLSIRKHQLPVNKIDDFERFKLLLKIKYNHLN